MDGSIALLLLSVEGGGVVAYQLLEVVLCVCVCVRVRVREMVMLSYPVFLVLCQASVCFFPGLRTNALATKTSKKERKK